MAAGQSSHLARPDWLVKEFKRAPNHKDIEFITRVAVASVCKPVKPPECRGPSTGTGASAAAGTSGDFRRASSSQVKYEQRDWRQVSKAGSTTVLPAAVQLQPWQLSSMHESSSSDRIRAVRPPQVCTSPAAVTASGQFDLLKYARVQQQ